jgi:hypothetical protein
MMLPKLQSKFPGAGFARISTLSDIWDVELDRIITRMLELSAESCPTLPLETKHEAVVELAKLISFIADEMIEKKVANSDIKDIDLDKERAWLKSDKCAERVENTAKVLAENVWIRFLNEWWSKHPVASSSERKVKRRKFARICKDGVRRQHFSPKFSNRYWADGQSKVRIYSPSLDGSVTSEVRPMGEWAREDYIYSQSLESLFAAIETDAGVPYKKLLDMVPFSEDDRRHWVAFLIAQLFRTPSYIVRHLWGLKNIIQRDGIAYDTDTASLRRAYETLFTNDQVFDMFYRKICGHEWSLFSAGSDKGVFIRGDVPVVIGGSDEGKNWRLIYPMTPFKCFVAGPIACKIPDIPIPRIREVDTTQICAINEVVAEQCRRSAMGVVWKNDSNLLESAFKKQADRLAEAFPCWEEYWGRPR